jgi:tetratricopeptide (TPR) repeat protein
VKRTPISPSRKRLFYFISALVPFLALALLELGLRTLNYGNDLSLFRTEIINDKPYLVMNPAVKHRYFSRVDFTPNTSYDYFQTPKPDSTFRIFCLGGSTTVGFPYGFAGSWSSFLRDRLHHLFPDKKIEVVNLGMTATNSFTVLDLAKELVDYEPDLFMVYDGHNEFYGAFGVASRELVGPRWMTLFHLKLIHFRSVQLFQNFFALVRSAGKEQADDAQSGTMMERLARGQYIPYASEKYNQCFDNFKANVGDLVSLCRKNNIPLFLGAQVSNLRDQPPFVSVAENSPTPPEVDILLATGKSLLRELQYANALASFEKALALDSTRADANYYIARCLDTLGRKREAFTHYVKARDYDMLRFRMSSDFNDFLRSLDDDNDKALSKKLITFVDIEKKFKANAPDSLIGSPLMWEHLHPTARGYFLIAKEYLWKMHWRKLLVHTDDEWNRHNNPDDEKVWNERPQTAIDERAAKRRIEMLTSGWPFHQEDTMISEVQPDDTLGVIAEQLVQGLTTWEQAHVAAAEHFVRRKEFDKVEREYEAIVNQLPLNVSPYLFLSRAYLQQQKNMEAAQILVRSLEVEKTVFAYKTLGMLAAEPKVSAEFFLNAFRLSVNQSERTEAGFLLAQAYLRGDEREKAATQLREVLSINPQFAPAQRLLERIQTSH